MSPVNTIGLLAFTSAVLAVPHAHEHQHAHLHHEARSPQGAYGQSSSSVAVPAYGSSSSSPVSPASSSGPDPYASSSWGAWGTGTGYYSATGYGSGSAGATGWYPSVYPSASSASPVSAESASWGSVSGYVTDATTTQYSTIYVTPSPAPAGWSSSSAVSAESVSAESVSAAGCTPDVTVTEKVTQTVYVTPGGAMTTSSSYSSPVAAASSSAASSGWADPSSAPAYSASSASSVAVAPTSSESSAPTYAAAEAEESSAATTASSDSYASTTSSGAVAALTSAVASVAGAFSGGKRGLAYNDASLVSPFVGVSGVGFAYNWVSNSGGLSSGIPYIPELHDMTSEFTSSWMSDAQTAIDNGAEYLFSFNEPDISSQANLSPAAAAAGWKQYMEPFAGKVKLVAPAVSNSATTGQGLSWLSEFMSECSDCSISAINLHWYDTTSNDISYFEQQISDGASQSGLPVFVGEFGFIGSDSDITSSLTQAMASMDSNDDVIGYAYYMLASGLLLDGTTASPYGLQYLS